MQQRLAQSDVFTAAIKGAIKGFEDGYGQAPTGQDTMDALRYYGITPRGPNDGGPMGLRFFNQALLAPLATASAGFLRSLSAVPAAVGEAAGAVAQASGTPAPEAAAVAEHAGGAAEWYFMRGDMGAEVVRAEPNPAGGFVDQRVGPIPTPAEVPAQAEAVATQFGLPEAAARVTSLYNEKGVLPAEVSFDAANNPEVIGHLAGGPVPGVYGGEPGPVTALPNVAPEQFAAMSEEAALREQHASITEALAALPQGDISAADRLNRLDAVEAQLGNEGLEPAARKALQNRRDQILVDTTPEALREAAAPFEQRRALEAQQASIEQRLGEIAKGQQPATTEAALSGVPSVKGPLATDVDTALTAAEGSKAPAVVQAAGAVRDGLAARQTAEPIPGLADALTIAQQAEEEGKPVRDLIGGEGHFNSTVSPETEAFLRLLYKGRDMTELRSPETIKATFETLTREMEGHGQETGEVLAAGGQGAGVAAEERVGIGAEPRGEAGPGPVGGAGGAATEPTGAEPAGSGAGPGPGEAGSGVNEPAQRSVAPPAGKTAPTALRPIEGTGETKTMALAESTEEAADRALGELPESKTAEDVVQKAAASKLLALDPDRARAIAMGTREPPKNLLRTAVYEAVLKKAMAEGDYETIRALGTEGAMSGIAKRFGQEISFLRNVSENDPSELIAEVQQARADDLKARGVDVMAEADKAAPALRAAKVAAAPPAGAWTSFIQSLTCA